MVRQTDKSKTLFQMSMLSAACMAGIGLASPTAVHAQLSENWDSISTGGALSPSSPPGSGTPYTFTSSGSNGMGTWTALASDPTNAFYAVGPTGSFGAGGSGQIVGEGGASHDSSSGSSLLQSPAFYLSDAVTGGSISITYVGGAWSNNGVPPNISGLGTGPGNSGAGFMGVALVDPSGNIVASSNGFTTAGSGGGAAYTLHYSGLSTATAYTFDLIDDGTRGNNWGWNGIDNISIPAGSFTAPIINVFNWTNPGTGVFSTGSNWDQNTAPSNLTQDDATISNGGTATIGSADNISLKDLYVGSSSGTNVGNVIQTGGALTAGSSIIVGNTGGTGSYNLSGSSSTLTAGSLLIGAGTGVFTQAAGTINVTSQFSVGAAVGTSTANGTGTFNMSGGSFIYSGTGQLNVVGYGSAASVLSLSGNATLNDATTNISIGDQPTDGSGAMGILTVSGTASVTTGAQVFIGNGVGDTGIANVSGGTITSGSWISIGRTGATGIVNLSGTGSLVKPTGTSGDISIGSSNTGYGLLNQSGGTLTAPSSFVEIAENTGSIGAWNMSGGSANVNIALVGYSGTGTMTLSGNAHVTATQIIVSYNTGSNGTLNLNGGTLTTPELQNDSGTATVNLNGGIIQTNANTTVLLSRFPAGAVNALAGGAIFDTNGFAATLTSPIASPAGVTGSFTKIGSGTLTLSKSNTYTGATTISTGILQLSPPAPVAPVAGAVVQIDATKLTSGFTTITNSGTGGGTFTAGNSLPTLGNTINGRQALVFDGSASSLVSNAAYVNTGSQITMFVVENSNNAPGYVGELSFVGPNGGTDWNTPGNIAVEDRPDGSGIRAIQNNTNPADLNRAASTPLVWDATLNATAGTQSAQLTYNSSGSAITTTAGGAMATNAFNLNQMAVGARYSNGALGNFFSGSIGEVLIYNTALSPSDTAAVEAYLEGKWLGIGTSGGNLPTTTTLAIAGGASFDLNGNSQQVASLTNSNGSGGGVINSNAGTTSILTVASTVSSSFGGNIQSGPGAVGLTLAGTNLSALLNLSGSNTYTGPTNVTGGTLIFTGANAFPVSNVVTVGSASLLVLASQTAASSVASMNVSGNVIVHGGDIHLLTTAVGAGYANGTWTGSSAGAIGSGMAASDSTHLTAVGVIQNSINGSPTGAALLTTFEGQPVSNSDVLVKYTYYGDTDLNGKIDGTDYSRIDVGFMSQSTTTPLSGWFNGDFNYDGVIDGSDYTLIDNTFNTQGAQISAELATATAQVGSSSAVPEPATLSLIAIGAAGLLGRRRHR